ncbi:glycoside hydrolase family 2 TIM barrel-domain containing protein [Roseibacillus persicicus]|uniref:CBM6 domain-containing protein n=1 Tax=Roseibacillus persicicus TaxID=454148 RepID=A0A918TLK6_9BACT|nr:glycoside hydrolase family 2 TIM barrel-domain containing protein [Roseibacillus persicicus]GHC50422.1 hypothetical protein GCM10007100_15690 [Roseibacillus persicicus]
MKPISLTLILTIFLSFLVQARETFQLDDHWTFAPVESVTGKAPSEGFRPVQIPHDWSWEAGPQKGGAQADKGGYRIGGVGWYRCGFTLPESFSQQRVVIQFDGVYRNATVFLNGHELGSRPYGFISFEYEVTPFLKDGENLLEVRVDCSKEPSTRWYHPCGIYAPVRLEASHPGARLVEDEVFITTPEITAEFATVNLALERTGEVGDSCLIEILDDSGALVASNEASGALKFSTSLRVKNPSLWSPDSPTLYTARVSLLDDGKKLDELEIPFGIRSIRWDAATGFHLNGEVTKLKGVCEHLTGGPVGGAWPEPLLEWKLRLLKTMGCNAIRTAHNPQIPAFYDLCDRLGILVMNEAFDGWKRKAPQDYGALDFDKWWREDLSAFIRRDRNHPCVVVWSVGNETGGPVAKQLVEVCHQLDPTRPVTSGHSGSNFMDVYGVNGHSESQKFFKEKRPDKPFVATEAPHTWQVRGFYKSKTWYRDGFPNKRQQPFETPDLTEDEIFSNAFLAPDDMANGKQIFNSSYDNGLVRINARQNWEKMRDLPWYSGHFRWTGFDYPGEAGYVHGGWPFHSFAGGALDLGGFKKDLYYFYQSQWTSKPMVHILPHWTHPGMKPETQVPIHVYSNADEIELFHNGQSLGAQKPGLKWDEMQCEWMVPWIPGELIAVARNEGREVARHEHHTSGAPRALQIEHESLGKGFHILTLSSVDEEGHFYPYGENSIFTSSGSGVRILSFENGHLADTDKPVAANRRAFMGKARLFLEGEGEPITVGAILGERRQLTSEQVAIDVLRVEPTGEVLESSFAIHYTSDGSQPTTASPRYHAPFPVPSSCVVKAVAYLDGEPVLKMEESFGSDFGLHWYDASEVANNQSATALQAESAKFSQARVSSYGKGFNGKGYLDFGGREGKVEFYQENDGPAGQAILEIRYALADPKRTRPVDVIVNGKTVSSRAFPRTESWSNDWRTIEIPCEIRNGANTILLKSKGQSAPNIDQIEFR